MSRISVDVSSARIPVLQVGYQGENEVTDVLFDISSWITEFGDGVAQLRVKRPGNSEEESYVLSLTITDGIAVWTVSETDTFNKGNGKVQLSYMVGNIVKKAVIYPYKVGKSIVGADNPVDPFDSWIERSKAWAIGETLDGDAVPETDETYQNNAKYYAEQADILGSAQVVLAAEKVTLAAEQADAAAASEAAVNGVSTQLTTRMSAIETEQAVQDARMDTFTSLPEGSTSGNAELADIRVGADGTTYDTAGNAVRGQIGELKSDLDTLIIRKTITTVNTSDVKSVMIPVSIGDIFEVSNDTTNTISFRFVTSGNEILQETGIVKNTKVRVSSTVDAHHIRIFFNGAGSVTIEGVNNAKIPIIENEIRNLKYINDVFDKSENIANTNNDKEEYWFDSNGNIVPDEVGYAVSNFIPVKPNTSYGVKGCIKMAFYDSDKNPLSVKSLYADDGNIFVTGENVAYIVLGYKVSYRDSKKIVVKEGYTIPTYTEYFDDTIKFDFIKRYFPNYSSKTFYRDVNYDGIPVGNFYTASDNDSSFSEQTTLEQFYTQLDSLINENNSDGYVTKKALGISSYGNNQIYEYDFTPIKPLAPNAKEMPKIIMFSGQHGGEESNIYGMYYFINDLLTKWDTSPVLDYIRNHVIIKWIPIANPYGFENNSYLNTNGVNLNRNYDMSGFPAYPDAEQGTSQYGGVTPFDQPETQIIRDFINDNLDAVIGIDHHSFGGSSITEWERVNWITMVNSNDRFYNSMADCLSYHFSNMTGHLSKQFNLSNGNESLGYYSVESNTFPSADAYMLSRGIASITFEGFNGFKNSPSFTTDVYKANAELIGNFIIAYLHHVANANYTFIE